MPPSTTFDNMCIELRKEIKRIAEFTKKEIDSLKRSQNGSEKMDTGEMIANLTLSYRHLEDASMRIGKAIQAYEGGVSIYDKDRPERNLNEEVPKV